MFKKLEDWLLFLIVLFLPTQLGLHFWPDFSYIYSLKIDYLSPTLYFWDILVVAALTAWIKKKPKINKMAINLFLFFLFTQVLSLLGAENIGAGLVRLEQYTLAGFFGVYVASQDFKNISAKIFLPLTLGVLGEGILAVSQFFKGGTLGLWILGERTFTLSTPGIAKFDFYGSQFLRPYATFPHPNVLAAFMLLAVVILRRLAEGSPANAGLKQTVLGFSVFFAGLTVFLTMSRVAILAGFVALVIFLKRKSIIFIIILILSPVLFTRFSSLLNFDNLALLRREELVGSAWQMFLQHPVFGVGLNYFIPTAASNMMVGPSRFLQPVHNIFLLALSETGIIGLIGLICLIWYPIRTMVYGLWFMGKTKPVITIYDIRYTILPWFIILFLGMFDHYFLTLPQGYRLLFLVWGLSFSRIFNRQQVM